MRDDSAPSGLILNGIFNGLNYAVGTAEGIKNLLKALVTDGRTNKIVTIFTIPALAINGFRDRNIQEILNTTEDWFNEDFKAIPYVSKLIQRPDEIDGYIPRNKKLLTYPYLYIGLTAYNSDNKIYKYENFENNIPEFTFYSEISPNPSVIIIPKNYRGSSENLPDRCVITGYPTVAWVEDYYSSWLAQNSNILSLNMAQEEYNYNIGQYKQGANMLGTLGNIGKGDFGGLGTIANQTFDLMANDVNHEFYIKQQMAQIESQKLTPNPSHMGTSATALGYNLMNKNVFSRYSIKKQFAEKIDKYFDMYGYTTNTVKKPNIKNRSNWNYIKTIGINLKGNIPQMDLNEIKTLFDNGLTIWHNPNTFCDYSQAND